MTGIASGAKLPTVSPADTLVCRGLLCLTRECSPLPFSTWEALRMISCPSRHPLWHDCRDDGALMCTAGVP